MCPVCWAVPRSASPLAQLASHFPDRPAARQRTLHNRDTRAPATARRAAMGTCCSSTWRPSPVNIHPSFTGQFHVLGPSRTPTVTNSTEESRTAVNLKTLSIMGVVLSSLCLNSCSGTHRSAESVASGGGTPSESESLDNSGGAPEPPPWVPLATYDPAGPEHATLYSPYFDPQAMAAAQHTEATRRGAESFAILFSSAVHAQTPDVPHDWLDAWVTADFTDVGREHIRLASGVKYRV